METIFSIYCWVDYGEEGIFGGFAGGGAFAWSAWEGGNEGFCPVEEIADGHCGNV